MEEAFEEAVVADDFQSATATGGAEPNAAVLFVEDEGGFEGGELLQHAGDGGGPDAEVGGEGVTGDAGVGGAGEFEDGLEVIIDGFSACA